MSVVGLALSVNYRGPLHALGARAAEGKAPSQATGYGSLVPKGDLRLPAEFNYQIISRQAVRQHRRRYVPSPPNRPTCCSKLPGRIVWKRST